MVPDELWPLTAPLPPPTPEGGQATGPKARRIADRIAGISVDSSSRLGRYRWVVERTGA